MAQKQCMVNPKIYLLTDAKLKSTCLIATCFQFILQDLNILLTILGFQVPTHKSKPE